MHTNLKTLNEKELQLNVLVDLECIYIGIDEQLVKKEHIKIAPSSRLFKVFNVNRTKSRKVTSFALLKLETNRYIENINIVVTNLNGIDILS